MTPAINQLIRLGVHHKLHEYIHDAKAASYGTEAAEKLAVNAQQVFKTLIVDTGQKILAVAILPVNQQLNLKLVAKALNVKKVTMADPVMVKRCTGYVLGGISPVGQKRALTTIIDASANAHKSIYVSGGRRGLEIELTAYDLSRVTNSSFAVIT
jgi:Cys-tRNA(Pro)/Cys-tRNA(Cys) deacylase